VDIHKVVQKLCYQHMVHNDQQLRSKLNIMEHMVNIQQLLGHHKYQLDRNILVC
jgi:hypothetical protein